MNTYECSLAKDALKAEGIKVKQFVSDRLLVYGLALEELVEILKVLGIHAGVKRLEKLSNNSLRIVFY